MTSFCDAGDFGGSDNAGERRDFDGFEFEVLLLDKCKGFVLFGVDGMTDGTGVSGSSTVSSGKCLFFSERLGLSLRLG